MFQVHVYGFLPAWWAGQGAPPCATSVVRGFEQVCCGKDLMGKDHDFVRSEGISQEGPWLGLHWAIAYKLGQGGGLEALEASLSLGVCFGVPEGRDMNQCVHSPCYPCRPLQLSWQLGWCWGAGGRRRQGEEREQMADSLSCSFLCPSQPCGCRRCPFCFSTRTRWGLEEPESVSRQLVFLPCFSRDKRAHHCPPPQTEGGDPRGQERWA